MIPKKNRLPVQNTRGRRSERVLRGEFFTVRVYSGGDANRFGMVIGLNVDKRSVRRHYWKRKILHAAVRWPNMKKDFVIIAAPGLHGASEQDVSEALRMARDTLVQLYA